jgi:hypothetical protein
VLANLCRAVCLTRVWPFKQPTQGGGRLPFRASGLAVGGITGKSLDDILGVVLVAIVTGREAAWRAASANIRRSVPGEPPEPHEQVGDRAAGSNAIERQVVVAPPAICALNLAAAGVRGLPSWRAGPVRRGGRSGSGRSGSGRSGITAPTMALGVERQFLAREEFLVIAVREVDATAHLPPQTLSPSEWLSVKSCSIGGHTSIALSSKIVTHEADRKEGSCVCW